MFDLLNELIKTKKVTGAIAIGNIVHIVTITNEYQDMLIIPCTDIYQADLLADRLEDYIGSAA